MDSERAREIMSVYVKEQFGKIVELMGISVVRATSGRVWVGNLICVTSKGDVEVGGINVTEEGKISGALTVDDLIRVLSNVASFKIPPKVGVDLPTKPDIETDFSQIGLKPDADGEEGPRDSVFGVLEDFFADSNPPDLRDQIARLVSSGEREDLLKARESIPQLLVQPSGRGLVLKQMGEIELKLGNARLALEYLEAAAREFSDFANLDDLEKVAGLAVGMLGQEAYSTSRIKALLDATKERMKPIYVLESVQAFEGLSDEEMFEIAGAAELIRVDGGETLLKEGEPAVRAFVVKSGILSVQLETPDGGTRGIRCCFPGDFVGESSVLAEDGATCNATVSADCKTSLWRFDGSRLKELVQKLPSLKQRIESARAMHQLDSFFSMNQATDTLDTRVRERLLSCIASIRQVQTGEILSKREQVPEAAYLIIEGRIEYGKGDMSIEIYGRDEFVGLNDTLHELPLEGDFMAVEPCRVVVFDPNKLKKLVQEAPAEVIAVLERLG